METITAFTQCSDCGVEPGRWVRSVFGGCIDPRLHSDPVHGADPATGADRTRAFARQLNKRACKLKRKFRKLRGQTRLSVYTHEKCGVRPRIWGRTLLIRRSTKGGSDPAIGARGSRLHGRAKGGSDPASGVRPRNRSSV